MSLKGHTMTQSNIVKFSTEALKETATYTRGLLKAEKDAMKMLDVFIKENIPVTHFISPVQGANKALSTNTVEGWNALKRTIEDQYTDQVKALIAMSSKAAGNTYVGTGNRANWIRKSNSIIGGIHTAYTNRLKVKGLIEAGKMDANARTRPPEVKVTELLVDARSRIQKADTFKSKMDVDAMVEALNLMIKSIG
tara:strand:- start:830 stop:1414 length:585 start_codon:yes stop_codon:yes gene_type:complete